MEKGEDDEERSFSCVLGDVSGLAWSGGGDFAKNFDDLGSYWQTDIFMGNKDFREIIGHACLKKFCKNICTYPYYDYEEAAENPIWKADTMLDHTAKNCTSATFPIRAKSLDENTVRCNGKNCD